MGSAARLRGRGVANMPVEALGSVGTVSRGVGLAYRPVGGEAVVVDLAEEGREVKSVGLGRVLENHGGIIVYLGRCHGGRSVKCNRWKSGRDSVLAGRIDLKSAPLVRSASGIVGLDRSLFTGRIGMSCEVDVGSEVP